MGTGTVRSEINGYPRQLGLYTEATTLQRAASTADHPVYTDISNTPDAWANHEWKKRWAHTTHSLPSPGEPQQLGTLLSP
jgi:hypothetical protein